MKKSDWKYLTAGALAGLANGFFGAGGGMFLVPMFCRWAKMEEQKAFATSIAVILPMSIVSSVVYYLRGSFRLIDALPFLIGGLVGGLIGGKVFKKVPTVVLRRVLGVLILYGGVRSLFF